jgi:hypothetical protein
MSEPRRWLTKACTVLACSFAFAGCAMLPEDERRIDSQVVERELERELGLQLRSSSPPPVSTTLANLETSYEGEGSRERVLVLVFDTPAATAQVTGEGGVRNVGSAQLIRKGNIVVLYNRPDGEGGRRGRISSLLTQLYQRAS